MPITHFPNGISSFGGVVGPPNYAGWWGKKVWFVDDDDGSDGNKGREPEKAFKTIQKAIDLAGPLDTIFLKPREIDLDTHSSHGYYTGSNIIPTAMAGLSIIGTGRGGRGIGMSVQCMVEPDTTGTDVAFDIQSPAVSIENLGIKAITGSNGAIFTDVRVEQAYGLTVSNCFFKDFKAADASPGTINLITTHWATIQHCYFKECGTAIHHLSTVAAVRNLVIRDCDFVGDAATWGQDIVIGAGTGIVVDDCRFAHAARRQVL